MLVNSACKEPRLSDVRHDRADQRAFTQAGCVLGVGLSTLNKCVAAHRDTELVTERLLRNCNAEIFENLGDLNSARYLRQLSFLDEASAIV